ncbi:MAG: sulfur oxidation c-type cytochrome SoxA [Acidobacteria bacterium]|jgi:sulfur-oxidizing protein SoxA|nr:MAG: sulfur oxidation c-type cytochrome SoxA [Acidobacteriota bacterium]
MRKKLILAVFTTGALAGGLFATKAFAQTDVELTPEQEIKLVQEYNRLLAEGVNPGEVWYEVGKEAIKKYKLDKCDLGLGPGNFKGAAAKLPRYFPDAGKVMDLETRVGWCLQQHGGMKPEEVQKFVKQCWGKTGNCLSEYDGIIMYLTMESNGQKISVDLKDPRVKKMYEIGKAAFNMKLGPWDFNCVTCHAGKQEVRIRATRLWSVDRGEAGQAVHYFPKYLVRWGLPMSMHYRYAECIRQMRWPEFIPHSDLGVALSTYLYAEANGTEIKAPGIGR